MAREIKRDAKGKFVKAPKRMGRPPGSKNKTSLLKEALKQGAETKLFNSIDRVLEAVLRAAASGDMQACKMVLDRALPISSFEEKQGQRPAVKVTIVNAVPPANAARDQDPKIIDATPKVTALPLPEGDQH